MASGTEPKLRRPESVLIVVYTHDAQTLLLKRVPPRSFWQSVTGSIQWQGETKVEAAVRELAEETGIEAESGNLQDWNRRFRFTIPALYRPRYGNNVQFNTEHVFSLLLPAVTSVSLQPSEHDEFCWVDLHQARNIVWSWSNREALEMVISADRQG